MLWWLPHVAFFHSSFFALPAAYNYTLAVAPPRGDPLSLDLHQQLQFFPVFSCTPDTLSAAFLPSSLDQNHLKKQIIHSLHVATFLLLHIFLHKIDHFFFFYLTPPFPNFFNLFLKRKTFLSKNLTIDQFLTC